MKEARGFARVLAVLAGLPALALAQGTNWVSFGESETTAYYFDAGSIRSDGPHRRVWRLFDYKQPQRSGVRSGKALIEIHCEEGTYRYLRTMYYSGPMGKGKYLGGLNEHRKEYYGPGTLIGQLAKAICEQGAAKKTPSS